MYSYRRRRSTYRIDGIRLLISIAITTLIIANVIMGIHVIRQNSEITHIDNDVEQLASQSDNLNLSIDQYYNLDKIKERAEALGMVIAEGDQVRVVSLPSLVAEANANNNQP